MRFKEFVFDAFAKVISMLSDIQTKVGKMSQGMADLNTSLTNLTAEVAAILADVQTALLNSDSDAAVEQASQVVNTAIANLKAGDPLTGTPAQPPASDVPPVSSSDAGTPQS